MGPSGPSRASRLTGAVSSCGASRTSPSATTLASPTSSAVGTRATGRCRPSAASRRAALRAGLTAVGRHDVVVVVGAAPNAGTSQGTVASQGTAAVSAGRMPTWVVGRDAPATACGFTGAGTNGRPCRGTTRASLGFSTGP